MKVWKWLLKCMIAGLLALTLLSAFSFFYYNPGIHYTSKTGSTDYLWPTGTFYSRGTEGFAMGVTDDRGFINAYKPAKETIDVLLMGSSHFASFFADPKKNVAYVMNQMFEENGEDKYVYNISTPGHAFLRNIKNLGNAINEFNPATVIIETSGIDFGNNEIESVINGDMEGLVSVNEGLLFHLQKVPYSKLLYWQYMNYQANNLVDQTRAEFYYDQYKENLEILLEKVSEIAADNSVKLLVVFHPMVYLQNDGSAYIDYDLTRLKIFEEACNNNSIHFVDMTDTFLSAYQTDYTLPYGFINSPIGKGHLNADGMSMIAQKLSEIMMMEDR